MEYLLDTQLAFWSLYARDKVPKKVIDIIEDERNDIYVSSISIWEIGMKHIKNPKTMPISGTDFYHDCLNFDYLLLPFIAKYIVQYENIKVKDGCFVNKDPHDRMIIAQARHNNYLLCTADERMKYYDDAHIICF